MKNKTKNNGWSAKIDDSPEITFKASFDDLRRSDSRKKLRQHFTGAFPESQRQPFQDSVNNDMGLKDRMIRSTSSVNVSQNPVAESSSLNTDKVEVKKSSNSQNGTTQLDIEQAINLLQELKKTASPAELVALHKALLPTRDSLIASPSPGLPTHEEETDVSASYVRHRSLLPAGLATRGEMSEDPLRTPEEEKASAKLRRASRRRSQLKSKDSLAALDLADEKSNLSTHQRTETLLGNEFPQTGVYRPGTLRITNGAASPDLLSLHRTSADVNRLPEPRVEEKFSTAPSTPEERPVEDSNKVHLFQDAQSSQRPIMTSHERRQKRMQLMEPTLTDIQQTHPQYRSRPHKTRRDTDPAVSAIPETRRRDPSQSRKYKPSKSREASRHREQPADALEASTPNGVDTAQSREFLSRKEDDSRPATVESKAVATDFKQSSQSVKPNLDNNAASPMATEDMPRFAQRWSHRLSHISQQPPSDDRRTSGSLADSSALSNVARSIGTGQTRNAERAEAAVVETPEVALARLNGDLDLSLGYQVTRTESGDTVQSTTRPRYYSNANLRRPSVPQQSDSGYASEISHNSKQQTVQQEAAGESHLSSENPRTQGRSSDDSLSIDDIDADAKSLYTFDQILRSPSLLSPLATPSPPQLTSGKKHSSLLGFKKVKRSQSLAAPNSSELSLVTETSQTSPVVEQKRNKSQKKLQKPMPESVRKELRSQAKKKNEETEITEFSIIPPVSDQMVDNMVRRSFEQAEIPASTTGFVMPIEKQTEVIVTSDTGNESNSADLAANPPQDSIPRSRSKSRDRSRRRSNTIHETPCEDENTSSRSWSLSRKRSKRSKRRSTLMSKPNDVEGSQISCFSDSQQSSAAPGNDDYVPPFTDHVSVARSLGSSPYDQSTSLFRRTVSVPGAVMHQIQSPSQVGTSVSRSKSGGLRGMEAGMASELARMKSRDVAIQNNEEVFDRPRMATPKRKGEQHPGPERALESFDEAHPARTTKPSLSALPSEGKEFATRPNSMYAESIPPLPELPVNVGMKMFKLEGVVTRRPKANTETRPAAVSVNSSSTVTSVTTATSTTLTTKGSTSAPTSARNSDERPGDSTMSVADAIKRAMDSEPARESQGEEHPDSVGRRKSKKKTRRTSPSGRKVSDFEDQLEASPNQDVVGLGWDQHARAWKQRRESIGQNLGKPVPADDDMQQRGSTNQYGTSHTTFETPAIHVSRFSEDHSAPTARSRTFSAAEQAAAYQDLIGTSEDKENEPTERDASGTDISTLFNSPPAESAYTTKPYHSTTKTIRDRSPGGRVKTPSGNFHPYTPADAEQAEKSRLESLAKLTGVVEEQPATTLAVPRRPFHQQSDTLDSLIDRYSGGMQFGFQKGAGFEGSAGTRSKADGGAQRKGKKLSETHGVDLSDVPVFLRKVPS